MEDVLDTIKEKQQESVNDYERQIELLKDENQVLLKQNEDYLLYKDKYTQLAEEKNADLEKVADELDKMTKQWETTNKNE